MPYYFIELYTPKPAWLEMPVARRRAVIDGISSAMSIFSNLGVETLYMGECDTTITHASRHPFLIILKFDDDIVRRELMAGLDASGWYDYFEHTNAAGYAYERDQIPRHFSQLVNLATIACE